MSTPIQLLGMYLHLARASEQRRRPQVRDRLLVVAASIAQRGGLSRIACYCRHLILQHNPQHLIRRWPDLQLALDDTDFLHFLKQMQRRYPQEKAEQMMQELGLEMGQEREAYFSDEEYAAALLNVTQDELQARFEEEE